MGNTVSRSHIRDIDRNVAKATRANTRRNSTGFIYEPSASPPSSTSLPSPDDEPQHLPTHRHNSGTQHHPSTHPDFPHNSNTFPFTSASPAVPDSQPPQQLQHEHVQEPAPRRRERHPAGYSRGTFAPILPTASGSRPPRPEPAPSPRTAMRASQMLRVETPPRFDKPPRARKVVSFNENVHVVTYPNEESSCSSLNLEPPSVPMERLEKDRLPRRRGRGVFRLLARVAPVAAPQSMPANYFADFGEQHAVEDAVVDRGGRDDDRLQSFDSAKDLFDDTDLVISFEQTGRGRDGDGGSEENRSGIALLAGDDTVEDDFDYNQRPTSDADTLSLSDAHPSCDGIDEPEAIGDQLLSTGKDGRSDGRLSSSFNITPMWQRLRRVDELDAVTPVGESLMERAKLLSASDSTSQTFAQEMAQFSGEEGEDSIWEPVAGSEEEDGEAGGEEGSDVDMEEEMKEQRAADLLSAKRSDDETEARGFVTSVDDVEEDDLPHEALATIPVASVMYGESSLHDLAPPEPLSITDDPPSDGDPVLTPAGVILPPEQETQVPMFAEAEMQEEANEEKESLLPTNALTYNPTDEALSPILKGHLERKAQPPLERQAAPREIVQGPNVSVMASEWDEKGRFEDAEENVVPNRSRFKSVQMASAVPQRETVSLGEPRSQPPIVDTFALGSSVELRMGVLGGAQIGQEALKGGLPDLDMDDTCVPNVEHHSSGRLRSPSPSRIVAPLAGVFYGDDSSPVEPSSPENGMRNVLGLADYPEYAMLNGQGNSDSVFGSEPNTPLLDDTANWAEPVLDGDLGRQSREEAISQRQSNFSDRATRQPIPEVLLHDWSGSMPVEPNVEMVDSAPNSASSTVNFPVVVRRPAKEEEREFPNAALLLSSQLTADTSGVAPEESVSESMLVDSHMLSASLEPPRVVPSLGSREDAKRSPRRRVIPMNSDDSFGKSRFDEDKFQRKMQPRFNKVASRTRFASSELPDETGQQHVPASKSSFVYVPGLHPRDPKLEDFQIPVERKSFSDTGYDRRGRGTGRGISFIEREHRVERGREPASDFRTYTREPHAAETAPVRRLGLPKGRRRLSNTNMENGTAVRDEGHPFRGVVGRLVSGMHIAKKLVSPS